MSVHTSQYYSDTDNLVSRVALPLFGRGTLSCDMFDQLHQKHDPIPIRRVPYEIDDS